MGHVKALAAAMAVGIARVVTAGVALIPSHGHGVRRSSTAEPSVPVFMLPSLAARAARTSAEVAARRIAVEFTARLAQRRELAAAYAQLSPRLRSRYSLAAWRDGNDFPVLLGTRDVFSGFSIA